MLHLSVVMSADFGVPVTSSRKGKTMKTTIQAGWMACLLWVALPVQADGYSAGVIAGTDGAGVELNYLLTESLNVSLGFSAVRLNGERSVSDVRYKVEQSTRSVGFKASYFPFESGFHVTGGMIRNSGGLRYHAVPTDGKYRLNANDYDESWVAGVSGSTDLPKNSTYIGIGWGNPLRPAQRWNFSLDVGLQQLTSLAASLAASCNNTKVNQLQCSNLKYNVERDESQQLQSEVHKLFAVPIFNHWQPVLRVGAHYQF